MKSMDAYFFGLLEKEIRLSNAVSFLAAMLATALAFMLVPEGLWLKSTRVFGWLGPYAVVFAVFMSVYLATFLLLRRSSELRNVRSRQLQTQRSAGKVWENLQLLSDWQKGFLARFIVENRSQIHEYEIGNFKVAWGPEIEVLCAKRILRKYRGGVYEIDERYRQAVAEILSTNN